MTAQNLKKSLLNYAISGKLSANWRKENPNSRIPNDLNSRIPTDFKPPFGIPNSWQWVKLGDICEIYTGDSINKNFKEKNFLNVKNGIPYIATKDLENGNFNYENGVKITNDFLPNFKKAKPNSILMCIEGGSAGRKIGILSQEVCFGNKLCCFYSSEMNIKFLFYYFKSGLFYEIFTQKINGIIGGVSIKKLQNFYIPLPPLDEQEFIVNELERLMSLAHSYEVEFQKLENCKKELRNLKKSLLNYAISGKLSANWRKENPNSRIPNDLNSRIPTDFKPPFGIPNSWQWVKLGDICEIYTGDSINKNFKEKNFLNVKNGIPYIATKDLENGNFNYENGVKITNDFLPNFKKAKPNSILMCIEGGSAGRKIGILSQEVCFGNKLCCFYSSEMNIKFLFYYFKSGLFYEIFTQKINGIIGGVSIKKLQNLYIPLPPLDEQEKIVKKIDELFEILEVIENSL